MTGPTTNDDRSLLGVFDSPTGPIGVYGPAAARSLPDLTAAQAPDWPHVSLDGTHIDTIPSIDIHLSPENVVRLTASAYAAPGVDLPPDRAGRPGLVAANGLIGTLIGTFVARDPAWICLHAAALMDAGQAEGGLVVLAGDNLAGKSTLAIALMQQDFHLWCDDRLPVEAVDNRFEGVGLGLRPKLRLPLPAEAPRSLHDLVARHGGAREGDMVYLNVPDDSYAAYGEGEPVVRILILNRDPSCSAPALHPLSVGEAVKALVSATFAPHLDAMTRLDRLRAMAGQAVCQRFDYPDSFTAAAWLAADLRRDMA